MATEYGSCPPTCPGCPECEGDVALAPPDVLDCKATPGSICECELLYLAAINGQLVSCNERVRSLYSNLAGYYLRSCERGCIRRYLGEARDSTAAQGRSCDS